MIYQKAEETEICIFKHHYFLCLPLSKEPNKSKFFNQLQYWKRSPIVHHMGREKRGKYADGIDLTYDSKGSQPLSLSCVATCFRKWRHWDELMWLRRQMGIPSHQTGHYQCTRLLPLPVNKLFSSMLLSKCTKPWLSTMEKGLNKTWAHMHLTHFQASLNVPTFVFVLEIKLLYNLPLHMD